MKIHEHTHHLHARRLPALGLVATMLTPSLSMAAAPEQGEPRPIAADADPDCGQATVEIEIDVATGLVYLIDPSTRTMTLTDGDINIYFDSLGHVLVLLHYTSSDWNVSITPDDDPSVTYQPTNGLLRYSIDDDFDQYVFSSSEITTTSAMMNMVPVVPDVILRPLPNCPPPT
ncbi:MAG: hypothetical protein AAGF11_27290 [Myxococcota bacterium]